MIQEIFLKRAVNIRKEYLSIKYDISSYEKNIRDILNALESKAVDLNDLKKKLDENKIHDPEMAKSQLLKIMMELETVPEARLKLVPSFRVTAPVPSGLSMPPVDSTPPLTTVPPL